MMNNFMNMENLKNKLDKYEIKDEKSKYIFRANFKYMISSSIFFIIIAAIAIHSLYKGISGAERLTFIKIIFIVILLGYVVVAVFLLFNFKIVIENNEIFLRKIHISMENIESASVKIMRVNSSKVDKFLEIITKDKKKIQIRLNINNELLFLKLIQNQIGEKMYMQSI
ncbi:hypothetical protein JMUB3934_0755 [Leptotrichia wadei]|uniref:Uncharacterized protein n=2 Tax=Leptotrichia wadei TaxID=157687 RepID=A0A510KCQ8_9FUSO|nr:hypothetical protein JMUB3934_0755 [Leptotrichia wadei]